TARELQKTAVLCERKNSGFWRILRSKIAMPLGHCEPKTQNTSGGSPKYSASFQLKNLNLIIPNCSRPRLTA
ncbi:MAG: hypothetical protein NC401_19165, partial [Ruminococcus sp.]|nr:hypothetical protein [Ruminococcus sp.]